MIKKEYTRPNIGFTTFKNKSNINAMVHNISDPIGLNSEKMDPNSFKVNLH